jgi:hypothetical protein
VLLLLLLFLLRGVLALPVLLPLLARRPLLPSKLGAAVVLQEQMDKPCFELRQRCLDE